jgi:hypothetical protein
MNSEALAYNADPLSDVKPLFRKRMHLKPLAEPNLKKNSRHWKPPKSKRAGHLLENSSAQPVTLSTNTELRVSNVSQLSFPKLPSKPTGRLKYRMDPKLRETAYKYKPSKNNQRRR